MPLGHSFQISQEELTEIFARLQPHLPRQLKKVEPRPDGRGLHFEFTPFTGREEEPSRPATHNDPRLAYISEDDDETEHLLREKARTILHDVYVEAHRQWENAAYVRDLKQVVQDAPDRWRAYEQAMKGLEAAYAYLSTPEAAAEWTSALFRLVDAQSQAKAAAAAFDERAEQIAAAHERHLYADLSHASALAAAGYPEAKDWHITDANQYSRSHYSTWDTHPPLTEQVRRLVAQQDEHIAKVGRLSGNAPTAP
jgi:hypothetical protein